MANPRRLLWEALNDERRAVGIRLLGTWAALADADRYYQPLRR